MGNETLECADCGKVFRAKHLFNKHRKAHDKRHKCTVCSRAFGLKTDLERHSNLHRFSQFIYKCHYPDCKFRGSRRKDHLSAHLKQHHTKNGKLSLGNAIPFEEHQRLIQHQQNVEFLECVRRGDKKIVERFLSENGSIQVAAQDSAGSTALHICSMKGHTSLIAMLLKLGIDINVLDRYQNTALPLAVTEKKYDVVRILLENGADVNAANEKGDTTLHYAAWIGDGAMAGLLIDYKVDHEARCWHSYSDLPKPWYDARNLIDSTPLHLAADKGHLAVVRLLLDCGASVDTLTASNYTPLHLAADKGHLAVVRLLLDCGASVDTLTASNHTPLHLAANKGHLAVVRLLLGGGASVDSLAVLNYTPLHLAALQGHSAVVGPLLGGGASVDSLTESSYTPLHLAADKGHSAVVGLLLSSGASVDSLTESSYTPLHLAARAGDLVTAKLLLAGGANVEPMTRSNGTPLHLAFEKGHIEVARLLLNNGSCVDPRNDYDQTPLHQAAKTQNPKCVELLLEADAQFDTKDCLGHTPLSYTIRKKAYWWDPKETHEDSTKLLLAARAKFSLDDWSYLSPEYKNMFAHYRPAEAEGSETSDPDIIPWIAEFDQKYADIVQRYSERGTGQ
ncbi:hypothetical protein IFR04_012499 [Cadophora malorum]|uniref:C2H2-type domain-containing protein n=1 Tax=Cadophora malorum TaxID=108018 RepID=A0A8H7T8C4_9HELO|nr:hypothetical protein IFR04_012499 [Cadophora malorum]